MRLLTKLTILTLIMLGYTYALTGISVSLPDVSNLSYGESIEIPITVSDLSGSGIYSYYADVSFPGGVLHCTGVSKTGTVSANWSSPTVNTAVEGRVILAAFGVSPLAGQGTLLKINFTVTGTTGQGCPLMINVFCFNEGSPLATTQNGYVSVGVTNLPTTPLLSMPENAATNLDLQPTLSWFPVLNAQHYQLQVATSNIFTSGITVADTSLSATSCAVGNLQSGTVYYWRVKASNTIGSSEWSQIRYFTTYQNYPPVSTLPETISFQINHTFSLNIQSLFTDANADPISVVAHSSFHIIASLNTWTLQLVPSQGWSGTEVISFSISDGYNQVEDTISVTITTINMPPVIAMPSSLTFTEDGFLAMNLASYISDPDNSILTVSVQNSAHISVSIVGLMATLSAAPNWHGSEVLTFTVSDGAQPASAPVNVIVTPVNDAPLFTLPASFTFAEDGNLVVDMAAYVFDVDSSNLVVTSQNTPHLTVSMNGMIATITASANWYGSEPLLFVVTDGYLNCAAFVDIIVTPVNDIPYINLPASFSFDEDGTLQVNVALYSYDLDYDSLALTVSGNTNITVAITGMIVTLGTPSDWYGAEELTFYVNDNQGRAIASDVCNITVLSVNDPPSIVSFLPEQTYLGIDINDTIAFSIVAQDIDSPLQYSWFVNNVNQDNASSAFSYQFTQFTTYFVKVIVSDSLSAVEQNWIVSVPVSNFVEIVTPLVTGLHSNYPNPFNPSTTIRLSMKSAGYVNISIYDIKGQLVTVLKDGCENYGISTLTWNGCNAHNQVVASGVYYVRMKSTEGVSTLKIVLLK